VDARRLYYINHAKSMGKRELLLVLGFVVVGTLMYQLTARPAAQGEHRFSLSTLIDHVRRGVRGNRATAETTTAIAFPLSDATSEVRVAFNNGSAESLTISGEDRADVASELHVWSNGFDEQEAQRLAAATILKANEAGGRMTFTLVYPKEARQRADLTLRVPSTMRVSVARYSGKLSIAKTGDVELVDSRGEATVREVTGRVSASHRGGELNIADVAALKLVVRGTDVRLARVHSDVTIQSQAGEVNATELEGSVDIESNNTDITLERIGAPKAPVHVTATNGSVKIRGVRSETRIDARNAEIVVGLAQPASVAVYAEGGEQMEITPPAGGFELDAVATAGGRITVPEKLFDVKVDGAEQRASGAVNGGGPTITLRATHGEIVVRAPESERTPDAPHPPRPPRPPAPPKLERR
jgi:DUF4097 and DUF4098 domain-containing protein YvlB